MNIDYFNPPEEDLVTLMKSFPKDSFLILEDVLETRKSFKYVFQRMIDIMKLGFEVEEIRHYPVHFKFKENDQKIHVLPMNAFIFDMVFWYGFMDMDRVDLLTEKYFIDPATMDRDRMCNWINDVILENHPGNFNSKNKTIDEIRHNQAAISKAFSMLMGLNVSIRDIIFAAKENPQLNDLLHLKLDEKMQPSEIENYINQKADELIDILKQTKCGLQPLLVSGKNLSKGQTREIFMTIALKSNINGHTIPVVVNTNFLVDGLYKPSYLYASALGSRKALILSKKYMSVPGAFSKKINLLSTSASTLRQDNEICDSVVTVDYHIKDKNFLKLLDKRYYYDADGTMKVLNFKDEESKELIGKKIRFRSPCTCNFTDGICKYCYGELYDLNQDLFSAGSFAATKNSEPLGQKVLSSKHEQNTDSSNISFNDEFYNYFDLSSTEITLLENVENEEELSVILDGVQMEEVGDEEFYFIHEFKLYDEKSDTVYVLKEQKDTKLYLSNQLVDYYKKMKDKTKPIPLANFTSDDGDVPLFVVEIESAEVTEPIRIIESVLNNPKDPSDISAICQAAAEAFTSIGINYNFVHIEMIIRGLIRRKSDREDPTKELQRPDFSRLGESDDIQVLNVNMGLKKNPSALVSLSYGYVRQVLTSANFYQKKEPSHLDALFVDKLSDYIDQ